MFFLKLFSLTQRKTQICKRQHRFAQKKNYYSMPLLISNVFEKNLLIQRQDYITVMN